MTGPEHYRLAENLLAFRPLARKRRAKAAADVAAAQVHATLALAAATAAQFDNLQHPAWWKVTSNDD